jgi:hypothetical protein
MTFGRVGPNDSLRVLGKEGVARTEVGVWSSREGIDARNN